VWQIAASQSTRAVAVSLVAVASRTSVLLGTHKRLKVPEICNALKKRGIKQKQKQNTKHKHKTHKHQNIKTHSEFCAKTHTRLGQTSSPVHLNVFVPPYPSISRCNSDGIVLGIVVIFLLGIFLRIHKTKYFRISVRLLRE
jgi:hypothetical protein